MKKIIVLLFLIFGLLSSAIAADYYFWRYRTHATDCGALSDGKSTDLCYEQSSKKVYKCVPGSGTTCDDPTDWKEVTSTFDALGDVDTTGIATGKIPKYNSVSQKWEMSDDAGASSGAPTDAKYVVSVANGTLTSEVVLASLDTGLLKVTTTTGALSTAQAGTDYQVAGDYVTTGALGTWAGSSNITTVGTLSGYVTTAALGTWQGSGNIASMKLDGSTLTSSASGLKVTDSTYLTPAYILDTSYDANTWNSDTTHAPSMNVVRDKFESLSSGYTNLTSFVDQTAWRVFYSDGSGDVKELALGSDGEYLKSNGASLAPSWSTPTGATHDAVTLSTDLGTNLLGLSTQQLTLDNQTANYIFSGPTTGAAAAPAFRALVDNDIPDTITASNYVTTGALGTWTGSSNITTVGALSGYVTTGALGTWTGSSNITTVGSLSGYVTTGALGTWAGSSNITTVGNLAGYVTTGALGTWTGSSNITTVGTLTGYVPQNSTMSITVAPSNVSASGIVATLTAGENLAAGDIVYLKSDGKYWKAKGDAASTIPCCAMATAAITANNTGVFLKVGFWRDDSKSWTVGGLLYVSAASGGTVTQTAPSSSGNQVQIVGYAYSATVIYFKPDYTYIQVA